MESTTVASPSPELTLSPVDVALERLLSATDSLRPFNAGDYDPELVTYREGFPINVGPYHDYDGRDLRLTAEGRAVAREIGERCAAAARELLILIGDCPARDFRDMGTADGTMRCLMILAAGVHGALAGPVPDAEVMHALAEHAQARYDETRSLLETEAVHSGPGV